MMRPPLGIWVVSSMYLWPLCLLDHFCSSGPCRSPLWPRSMLCRWSLFDMGKPTVIRKICLFTKPIPRPCRTHNNSIRDVWVFGICIYKRGKLVTSCIDVWFTLIFISFRQSCQFLLTMTAVSAIISLGLANVLVLLRVVTLWDNNKTVSRMMWFGFACSFSTTLSLMVATVSKLFRTFLTWDRFGGTFWMSRLIFFMLDGIQFNEIAGMCIFTSTTGYLVATWASPVSLSLNSMSLASDIIYVTHTHRCYLRSSYSSSHLWISSIAQGQPVYASLRHLLEMASISSWPLPYYGQWMLCLPLWTSPH